MNQEQLVFLISQPRSGSTLTQKLLGAHSKVYTRSEPWLMLNPLYGLKSSGKYAEYGAKTEHIAFTTFIDDLPNGKATYIKELRNMSLKLYSYYLKDCNKTFFLDKTPRYYLITKELLEVFPQARFILLIRNPLAVLGSIIATWTGQNWHNLSNSKYDLIRAIDENIKIIDHESENFLVVHYEELLSNHEHTLRRIFHYLSICYEEGVLNYHKNSEKWLYGDPKNIYEKAGIDVDNSSKWQESLNNPQYWRVMHDYIQHIGEENFVKLGYDYSENMRVLKNNMPASTLEELNDRTFSLFSLLDDTRECLIENQLLTTDNLNKDQIIKKRNEIIAQKDLTLQQCQDELRNDNLDKDQIIKERNEIIAQKDLTLQQCQDELRNLLQSKRYKLANALAYPYTKLKTTKL